MKRLITWFLAVVLLNACQQPDNKKSTEPISDKPADVVRNGVRIAYTGCGDADTTLLFVHGWCINKEFWEPQLKYFCSSYKVVAIDLPGFGQSGLNRTKWDFEEYTEDIKAVIEQLKLKNVILIGHSMSGDIILNASNKYPGLIAGIVGIDNLHEPGGPMSAEQYKETIAFFDKLHVAFDSTVSKYMKPSLFQPSTDTALVNRVMNSAFTTDSSVATNVLLSLVDISQKEKTLMQGLSHKLYLVNSDVKAVKTDSLQKYCNKGFQVALVHGTGHYPMNEKPTEFNAALEAVIHDIGK